ncbi:YbjN domain-containing protein [Saprospiraceae bacterium]|nr:YbjN domain-containing protein [Saprospiraceae bacterium]
MKNLIILITLICTISSDTIAQDMNNEKLNAIIYTLSDEVKGQPGNWQFIIDSTIFICITDELHNRMRIIAPIVEVSEVSDDQLKRCMEANFHSALDIRYAISDDLVWSAFIHPLKELTKEQVFSALSQVYSGVKTFGTYYSSGELNFPTREERDAQRN